MEKITRTIIALLLVLPSFAFAGLFEDVNELREENGIPALVWNDELADAAKLHAQYVYISGFWSHKTKTGKDFTVWMNNKYDYTLVGENIAKRYSPRFDMLKAWLKSETHRKNIYDDFDETGIGSYGNVTIQLFGKLK